MTADDATGFMDELVASNQKFGTDAGPEALSVLRNMSPALQAVGGDLDDGVGFLNLFETAGLDASAAAKGLNKSIKGLKPGQTLDDLIAQVGAIEDPLQRAQKAAESFGKKAGPKLAAAIKPGMTSLDDFKVSAEDAAGTTSKAANDMLTFGDKIKGVFDKIGAGAREMGQSLGPGITALGTIGSSFGALASTLNLGKFTDTLKDKLGSAIGAAWSGAQTVASKAIELAGKAAGVAYSAALKVAGAIGDALGKAWDALMGNAVIKSAVEKVGALAGGIYAGAVAVVEKLTSLISGAWTAMGLPGSSAIGAATGAGEAGGAAYGVGAAEGAGGVDAGIASKAAGLGIGGLFGIAFVAAASVPILDWLDKRFGQTPAQAEANAQAAVQPMADALTVWAAEQKAGLGNAGTEAIAAFEKTFREGAVGLDLNDAAAWDALTERAKQAAIAAGAAVGPAMASSVSYVPFLQTTADMADVFEHDSHNAGVAGGQAAADGLIAAAKDFHPESWAGYYIDKATFSSQAFQAGQAAMHSLARGLDSEIPSIRDEWKQYIQTTKNALDPTKQMLWLEGKLAGKKLADGLHSTDPIARARAEEMRDHIQQQLDDLKKLGYTDGKGVGAGAADGINDSTSSAVTQARQLAAKVNAAMNALITKYRVAVTGNFGGEHGFSGGGRAAGGPVEKGRAYVVGEHRSELFVPDENGRILPSVPPLSQMRQFLPGAQPLAVAVTVNLSTREFNDQQKHYAAVQGVRSFR
jgi:hypothetical protein